MAWYDVLANVVYPARAALGVSAAVMFVMSWRRGGGVLPLFMALMMLFDAFAFALLAIATGTAPVVELDAVVPAVRVLFLVAAFAELVALLLVFLRSWSVRRDGRAGASWRVGAQNG